MVTELNIITDETNIFSDARYIVPLYQRGYAWEEKHIVQLIDDIMDIPSDEGKYYIGSLIVHHRMDEFEVIDGQQRLTTLFLLLRYLEILQDTELSALQFKCRDKSNYTLSHIHEIVSGASYELIDDSRIQQELLSGYNIIKDKLKSVDETILIKKLHRTVIYRVEVPKHTDLNHYFEIMNTRGEQLEQSDVLKARLMAKLQGDKKWQGIFATIWDACRNMDGYVQMHFPKNTRETIFGDYWNNIPPRKPKDYVDLCINNTQTNGYSIKEAVKSDFQVSTADSYTEENQKVRFESIIDFPYFLLHTLRVYVHIENITSQISLVDAMLDDKKLIDAFERVIRYGEIKNRPIKPEVFVKRFIICLLRTRYLFDRYIIKREFVGDATQDGEWSLKEMNSYGQGGNKKAVYANTKVVKYKHNDKHNKEIIMLQAAMRVSDTSPKVMHWITEVLIRLSDFFPDIINEECVYEETVRSIAQERVIKFLNAGDFSLGVDTPRIVLNYLDYLLWKEDGNIDFNFEFRNSVEHWYPRHPAGFEGWDDEGADGVNRFGNLCLIQRNVNSRFSNMHPNAKKSTFPDVISKGSLKLRKMSEMTTEDSKQWKSEDCIKHEEDMINLLKRGCGMH